MTLRHSIYIFGLLVIPAFAALPDLVGDINRVLKSYYTSTERAQLYITLNQPQYTAGDTAFFSGYLFQANSRQNIPGKHIVTLQLLDSNAAPVFTNRYLFEGGTYHGYFIIPANAAPGYKLLRGFSDEMLQNNDSLGYLDLPLDIVTQKRQSLSFTATPQAGIEGGRLVANVPNRLVVLYTPATRMQVVNDGRQALCTLTTDSTGTATASFTPTANEKYYLQARNVSVPLGPVATAAASVVLNRQDADATYTLTVRASHALHGQKGYAIISNRDAVVSSRTFTLGQDTILTFRNSDMSAGINRITIFSDNRQVLSERLFHAPDPVAVLQTTAAQMPVQNRSLVALNVSIKQASGEPLNGRYSLSVLKNDLFTWPSQPRDAETIVALQAEGIRYRQICLNPDAGIDALLVACYTPTIPWEKLLAGQPAIPPRKKVTPYYFKARAVFRDTKLPVPDSTLLTFYLNKERFIFGRHTQSEGNFEFPMFMNFEDDELFYRAEYKKQILPGVTIIPDPLPAVQPLGTKQTRKIDAYEKFSSLRKVIDQSYKFYSAVATTTHGEEDEIKEWKDDFHVNLDALEPFASMPLVLQEVVPTVQVRNNKTSVRIFLKPSAMFATHDPVYIIDGVMTDSTGFFLSLPPADVSTIRVIRSDINLTRFGSLGRYGIIIVNTHHNKYASSVPNMSSFFAKGIDRESKILRTVQAPSSNSRVPDLRAALYWGHTTPAAGKATVQFSTSDLTGRFRIRMEGKTDTGRFVSVEDYIDVTYKEGFK
jgi:hypothetical protein